MTMEIINKALAELPESPSVNFAIANIYGKMERYENAEKHFVKAIELFDKNVQPIHYSNLGEDIFMLNFVHFFYYFLNHYNRKCFILSLMLLLLIFAYKFSSNNFYYLHSQVSCTIAGKSTN